MRILITAGGTREYIDPVRFISNASSGRMGYALARAALEDGHKVTLITAPTSLPAPKGISIIKVKTAAEMFKAVKKHFEKCDCLIMAAAVADYTPLRKLKVKRKKEKSDLTIKLKPTVDILKWAGKNKKAKGKKKTIIGFALEDKNLRQNAEKKLKEKNLDMIIANNISVIGNEKSTVNIKTPHMEWETIRNATKDSIAKRIIYLAKNQLE